MTAVLYGYQATFRDAPVSHEEGSEQATTRRVNPDALSDRDALDLVRAIEAGEVFALEFTAEVFGDVPNANRTRPEPGRLGELASSAVGRPLVRDHALAVEETVGTITAARVEERDGAARLVLDHRLTDPAEMIAFVRGQRRAFSIALSAERWECSECGSRAHLGFFGPCLACDHDLDEVEVFGTGRLSLRHNSFVSDPAYDDAGLLDAYRSANATGAAFFGARPVNPCPEGAAMTDKKTAAPETEATAPDTPDEAEALRAQLAAFQAREQEMEQALANERKARLSAAFDRAVSERRVTPSERATFDVLLDARGVDFALEQLAARKANPALGDSPVGFDAASTPAPTPSAREEISEWAAAREIVGPQLAKYAERVQQNGGLVARSLEEIH